MRFEDLGGEKSRQRKGGECGKLHISLSLNLQMAGLYLLHVLVFMSVLSV